MATAGRSALRIVMSVTLDAVRRALEFEPTPLHQDGVRRAAVAMILDDRLDVLLTQRAERPGDPWSGHLSFPGGHVEPADPSDLGAAIRETEEEVELSLPTSSFIGPLTPIPTRGRGVPRRIISPFVFHIDDLTITRDLTPNDEVAAVHHVPLPFLLSGEGRSHFTLQHQGTGWTLPQVRLGDVRLWGLTLQIVDELLDRLDGRGTGLDRPLGAP